MYNIRLGAADINHSDCVVCALHLDLSRSWSSLSSIILCDVGRSVDLFRSRPSVFSRCFRWWCRQSQNYRCGSFNLRWRWRVCTSLSSNYTVWMSQRKWKHGPNGLHWPMQPVQSIVIVPYPAQYPHCARLFMFFKVATYCHLYRDEPKEPTQFGSVSGSSDGNWPNFDWSKSGQIILPVFQSKPIWPVTEYLVKTGKIAFLEEEQKQQQK